ncbi:MAG: hypothetical protein HYY93_01195 [Planctomycetes bacterium]|nr:hypothetical protein [Planctomycetota bacterium]
MTITLTEGFQRDLRALPEDARIRVLLTLIEIEEAFRRPHAHSGIGLRKIHPSGIWEARADRGIRLVFGLRSNELVAARVGGHDVVQRYLRGM